MSPPLLTLTDIFLTFGRTPLLEGANFMLHAGETYCLVGRNGSGKSTLLKLAAGLIEADQGERFLKPGTTLRYLPQAPDLRAYDTVGDYVRDGLEGAEHNHRIPYLMDALALQADMPTDHLSGGEAKRASLIRTLVPDPDILMLDEPTNHLDLPAIEWLEQELKTIRSALVLISHDRRFLDNLSQNVVWLDRGQTRLLNKSFAYFEAWRNELLDKEQLEQHKLSRKIHREQHWVTHGVTGRRKRNMRRLKDLAKLKTQYKEHRTAPGQISFTQASGERSGKIVAKLDNISKAFEDRTLVKDFSLRIARGDRIALIGPNGAGKTTLLKLILGELEPDSGTVELGQNIEPLMIDQTRQSLDPEWTLSEALTDGRGDNVIFKDGSVHVMRYMKDFLFLPEQARTPLKALSGGELARVQLARGLRMPSNCLILDEPTNDLDIETLDLLQELVADYEGTVILVSHDRDFIDRTVTRTIAWQGPGLWEVYAGGYSDLKAQKAKDTRREVKISQSSSPASKPSDATSPKKTKSRLSYKHAFRLEKLPGEIAALETQISTLETGFSNPDLFQSNPEEFSRLAEKLELHRAELEALETEWLELEELKSQLGST